RHRPGNAVIHNARHRTARGYDRLNGGRALLHDLRCKGERLELTFHFLRARPWKQREDRSAGIDAEWLQELIARRRRCRLLEQRMTDERCVRSSVTKQHFLERQNDSELVGVLRELLHPAAMPRPHLWCDVVQHGDALIARVSGEPE